MLTSNRWLLPVLQRVTAVCFIIVSFATNGSANDGQQTAADTDFFEKRIRPVLIAHCYECHSEEAGEQQGGLLLDRQAGWIEGGDTNKAVIPGEPDASLLIAAVRYDDDDLQMPPDGKLDDATIKLLEAWVSRGAVGPADDMGEAECSRLGDQPYLFDKAKDHWAFKPVAATAPPANKHQHWNTGAIDQFVFAKLASKGLVPSRRANPRELFRRLSFDLTGLPPSEDALKRFIAEAQQNRDDAIRSAVTRMLDSPEFGQHIARMWLDVARYADTDSAYRADTKTPHYFPFAFSYRDYVVDAFNADTPYDQFVKEQFAADLIGHNAEDPQIAALGFLGVAPFANRDAAEVLDDWIDVTTRGLMGMTVACARCHDHKFEPIPTVDYYSLRGIFGGLDRPSPLSEDKQPILASYQPTASQIDDYEAKRAKIDKKMKASEGKKAKNNNRPLSIKIRDTELAELLLYHPGAPARSMIVTDKKKVPQSFVHIRGDASARGEQAPARFLKILDGTQDQFSHKENRRLQLVNKIASPDNPLTARVFVNRVWGHLNGSFLVSTPSDFGLQGSPPSHPLLLDWLTDDFVSHGWSTKRLVQQIVLSETYSQSSRNRDDAVAADSENRLLWRANRKHLSIEELRDSVLSVSGQLDHGVGGHAAPLWGDDYTRRRTLYGYINRFNLDPTLRAFDFPTPMQTQPLRGESIVATQALFLMNSSFVIDQCNELTKTYDFTKLKSDDERIDFLFRQTLQRAPHRVEAERTAKFVSYQVKLLASATNKTRFLYDPWPLIAQSLMMSNEFQYVD